MKWILLLFCFQVFSQGGGSAYFLRVPKSGEIRDILENLTYSGPKKYVGKAVTINVNDMPVPDLLKMIAEVSGFNIIIRDEVRGAKPMSLNLRETPWDQVLDTILTLGKLTAEKNENILVVSTLDQVGEEKKLKIENEKLTRAKEPLLTKVFKLSFAKSKEVIPILKEYSDKERGIITADERTQQLIVKDIYSNINQMSKILKVLDKKTPQIMIEAKIIEATERFTKNIGFENGIGFGYDPIGTPGADSGPGFAYSGGSAASTTTAGNFSFGGDTAFGALGFSVGIFRRLQNLRAMLNLMEQEDKGKIISSPKVVTKNNQKATIGSTQTRTFPIQRINDTTGTPAIAYEQYDASINLDVTPQVTNDGSISLDVDIKKQDFIDTQNEFPGRASKDIKTTVLVNNGDTVVLGGLYQLDHEESTRGVPFLRNIPLLGWLFRGADRSQDTKEELVIFLTPSILNNNQEVVREVASSNDES